MSESTETTETDMGTDDEAQTDPTTPPDEQTADDLAARIAALEADVTKWKGLARKHEKAAKGATEPAKAATPPPVDPVAELRAEMVREKAQDKLDAAAAKAGVDVSDILEYVDVEKFIDDGRVDTEAIGTFVGKFAEKAVKPPKFQQGIGVGQQGGGAVSIDQRISEAQKAGNVHEAIKLKREKARSQAAR
jgi:hypothetical protein